MAITTESFKPVSGEGPAREQPHRVLGQVRVSREWPPRPAGRPVRGHPHIGFETISPVSLPLLNTVDTVREQRASGVGGRRDAEHAVTLRSRKARAAMPRF